MLKVQQQRQSCHGKLCECQMFTWISLCKTWQMWHLWQWVSMHSSRTLKVAKWNSFILLFMLFLLWYVKVFSEKRSHVLPWVGVRIQHLFCTSQKMETLQQDSWSFCLFVFKLGSWVRQPALMAVRIIVTNCNQLILCTWKQIWHFSWQHDFETHTFQLEIE